MDYVYERLEAWQGSVDFSNHVITLLGESSGKWGNRDIVARAETSSANIALAIAKGKRHSTIVLSSYGCILSIGVLIDGNGIVLPKSFFYNSRGSNT